MDEYNSDEEHHTYADWILKDLQMLWHVNDPAISTCSPMSYTYFDIIYLQLGQRKKGLWLNEVFLKTLATHYTALQGAILVSTFGDPKGIHPISAMGLCSSSEVILYYYTCNYLQSGRLSVGGHFGRPEL